MTAVERLQYLTARMTSYLPARVQVWLSGEPPLVIDGKRYDSHAQLLRAIRRRMIHDGLVEPTVEAGRSRYRYETRVFRGPVTEVGSVHDFEIPGAAGPLHVRHYAARNSRDVTLYLHGGGFTIGDLDTHDEPCRILCRHARVHVLSVDYRLAPEHPFPAAVDDARAALSWALANAATIGAERVSVGGDSAGANLATVACLGADGSAPIAQLLIYPTTDLVTHRPSLDLFGEGFLLTRRDAAAFHQLYLGGTAQDDPRISPLRAPALSRLPPALIVTAGFDMLRDEGEAYAEALRRAGVIVRTRRIESLAHGFIHMTGVCRAAREAMIAIARDWRALLDEIG